MANDILLALGGYDPDHPNGNVIESVIDNGNGTGTRTAYDDKGQVEFEESWDAVDNGDGTHTRTYRDGDGKVTEVEVRSGQATPDIDPTHTVDDPIATEVAQLRAQNEALIAALDTAKVIDADAIRATAEGTKDDESLLLEVAKRIPADPAEVRKKRAENPQWFADVVAKYGLGGGKG